MGTKEDLSVAYSPGELWALGIAVVVAQQSDKRKTHHIDLRQSQVLLEHCNGLLCRGFWAMA
jgi:hypothetical protein